MNETSESNTKRRFPWAVVITALVTLCMTVWFHVRSFYRSEDLSLFDVSFFADEGILTMTFPLTRLTSEGECRSAVRVFVRGTQNWESGTGIRQPHRKIFEPVQLTSSPGGYGGGNSVANNQKLRWNKFDVFGFGYVYGSWKSEHRPGPWLKIFMPIWFLGLSICAFVLTLRRRLLKFKLISVFGMMTGVAVFAWLTHLRAP